MLRCPNCGAEYEAGLLRCPYCRSVDDYQDETEYLEDLDVVFNRERTRHPVDAVRRAGNELVGFFRDGVFRNRDVEAARADDCNFHLSGSFLLQ